jgi:hypothetical protein
MRFASSNGAFRNQPISRDLDEVRVTESVRRGSIQIYKVQVLLESNTYKP